MIETIQRLVALVTYANVTLNGMSESLEIDRLLAHNCYRMEFVEKTPMNIPGFSKKIATDPGDWISFLKGSKAKRVLLHFVEMDQYGLPDHITSAFVGGGSQWLIEVEYDDANQVYSFEERNSGTLKDQFILLNRDYAYQGPSPTVESTRLQIGNVLKALADFAESHEQSSPWASNFESAWRTLNESVVGNPDFIPSGIYSLVSHQLLETAFQSWVFGGMGSWNDLAFNDADQERYLKLTDELYKTICDSIVAGVNSYP